MTLPFFKSFSLLLLMIVFGGPSDSPYAEDDMISNDGVLSYSINPDRAAETTIADWTSDVKFTQLQIPAEIFLREVLKMSFNETSLFLLEGYTGDSPRVFSFDHSGDLNFIIDRPGRGPGEYELIYDFSLTDKFIVLSTRTELKYYDIDTGDYAFSVDNPRGTFVQSIEMIDEKTLVMEAGRTLHNRSKNLVKIYDLEQRESLLEAVPFEEHSLKADHSYRYLFYAGETLSIIPTFENTVYRVIKEGDEYAVKPAYRFNFQGHWIDQDLVNNSYDNRNRFFRDSGNYVHTVDVFETEQVIYADYQLRRQNYTYIYDKGTDTYADISSFSNNTVGWIGTPLATYENWIVNLITPFDVAEAGIEPVGELKNILENTTDEGSPILVFAKFQAK